MVAQDDATARVHQRGFILTHLREAVDGSSGEFHWRVGTEQYVTHGSA